MDIGKSLTRYLGGTYTQQDKQNLINKGILVKKVYPQSEVVRMIKERDFKNCVPKICEWCGKETLIIHKHHHPIEKAQGGRKTVDICPNCHMEYHLLINGNYELTEGGD